MPEFENYHREAEEIEREIMRKGIVLGIDWENEVQVRALAREALGFDVHGGVQQRRSGDVTALAKFELFGLAQLMLTIMRQSAEEGMLTHGGSVWKVFARALWLESGSESK